MAATISVVNQKQNPLRRVVRWGGWTFLVLLAIALALSWLVIVKTSGREPAATTVSLRKEQATELTASLTRSGRASDGTSVDMILTPPGFYRLTNRAKEAGQYGADRYVVFVANEHVHTGELPARFAPILRVDGNSLHVPSEVMVLADAVHHRTSVVVFKDVPVELLSQPHAIELLLPETSAGTRDSLQWTAPVDLPANAQPGLSAGMLLSLAAGLLVAISPCLLQLTAFYLPTLAGVSVDATGKIGANRVNRRRVMGTAFLFVLGFTIPYTLGGALIGGMGQALVASGVLNSKGPLAIGAGIVMIAMAGVVAYRARAPLVCKLPMPSLVQRSKRLPLVATFVSGFAIATGCLACFGGAILAVLLVYTGLLGSAWLGGASMFVFSVGIAIPFLLAAYSYSWVAPVAEHVQRFTPAIGMVSALVMLFFGIVMATGNYHVVSGWLSQNLPLS